MNKSENIIKDLIKSSNSVTELEREYNKIKKNLDSHDLCDLSVKDLKSLLAYEFLKDGADWSFALEILKSKDSKIQLLTQLEHFGY